MAPNPKHQKYFLHQNVNMNKIWTVGPSKSESKEAFNHNKLYNLILFHQIKLMVVKSYDILYIYKEISKWEIPSPHGEGIHFLGMFQLQKDFCTWNEYILLYLKPLEKKSPSPQWLGNPSLKYSIYIHIYKIRCRLWLSNGVLSTIQYLKVHFQPMEVIIPQEMIPINCQ